MVGENKCDINVFRLVFTGIIFCRLLIARARCRLRAALCRVGRKTFTQSVNLSATATWVERIHYIDMPRIKNACRPLSMHQQQRRSNIVDCYKSNDSFDKVELCLDCCWYGRGFTDGLCCLLVHVIRRSIGRRPTVQAGKENVKVVRRVAGRTAGRY